MIRVVRVPTFLVKLLSKNDFAFCILYNVYASIIFVMYYSKEIESIDQTVQIFGRFKHILKKMIKKEKHILKKLRTSVCHPKEI